MRPGYYIVWPDGLRLGPVANDNHERDTYHDERMKSQVAKKAKRLGAKMEYSPSVGDPQ